MAWQPGRIAGRASGVEVYKFESTELRARDSIRRTRNDADLGLVNSQTAEVTAVADVRDPSVLRIGPDDEPSPGRPRRRAQRATRSVPLVQFPRNIFRGTPRAFASDAKAREIARIALNRGYDEDICPAFRVFFYLPFEHSENVADQDRALELYKGLG